MRSGTRRTPSCRRREVAFVPFVLIRPVRWSIDGGSLSGLACRSPGPARSTRAEAADVHCGIGSWGSWGGQRPGLGGHVTGTGPRRGGPPPEGVAVAYPHPPSLPFPLLTEVT